MNAEADYRVTSFTDTYLMHELTESSTNSRILLCPERGGIMIGCRLHGKELFYLDRETFLNPEANIRGGNPILFPICGQLEGGQYEWEGVVYKMKNHGVARILPWETAEQGSEGSAWITLVLRSNEQTLASFPFEFELRFTYRLKNGVLSIEQQYINHSKQPMPMIAGFHPYFATDQKNLAYETDATRMLDYNDNLEKPFEGSVNLGGLVESIALLNARKRQIGFRLDGNCRVKLSYSEHFRYVVLWSVEGKPFVCVEPWTALNAALNRKEELIKVAPGDTLQADFHIACERT